MDYKVIYHEGDSVDLGTKVRTGRLAIEDRQLRIHGESELSIGLDTLLSVELFRLHNTGRMLKIVHTRGQLFVSVIRFNMFGYFAVVNFFATGRLQKELQALVVRNGSA